MNTHQEFTVKFPGSLEFIPAVRKYVSETLQANNCDPKFTYRSEIIVDEICNNAVTYGCTTVDASVELLCNILDDRIEFEIKDEGGKTDDVKRLNEAIRKKSRKSATPNDTQKRDSLGLEIVRMLSDSITYEVGADNLTTVRVVKLRDDNAGDEKPSVGTK